MPTAESFTPAQTHSLQVLAIVLGSFSIMGGVFIIVCYNYLNMRNFAFRLVLFMSIADILKSIANTMGNPEDYGLCQLQAWMKIAFGWASVLWAVCIAHVLNQAFIKENPKYHPTNIVKLEIYFHLLCWGLSFVISVIPFMTHSYGSTGAWCWIVRTDLTSAAERFALFYVPVWVCVSYNCYVYYQVWRKLKSVPQDNSSMQSKLKYYPLVIVIAYIFGFINRLYQVFGGGDVMWLTALMVSGICIQGAMNALAYGMTPAVRVALCGVRQATHSQLGAEADENVVHVTTAQEDGGI